MLARPVPVQVRRTDPDPSITSALGRHHSLVSAVADLVDNSIDAEARHVLIRVVQRDETAVGLLVVDDGRGMDAATIDDAMTYARRRDYGSNDLGHFGIGLKAASLSQADTLHVWSRRFGATAVGRGMDRQSLDEGPLVQEFSSADARDRLDGLDTGFALTTGTIVEWRDVRAFLTSPDRDEQRGWLETRLEDLRTHLGLVLHRILAAGRVEIAIDVVDEADLGFAGIPRRVEPLNPFSEADSHQPGYPVDLDLKVAGLATKARLHLWPSSSDAPGWLLGGRSPLESQGLYVYRKDRLLQAGGWNELAEPSRELIHARVSLDIDDTLAAHVTINPEKTGVVLDASVAAAFDAVDESGARPFRQFLDLARDGARDARRRSPRPVTVPEPGRGLAAGVVEALVDNATFTYGRPVDVRWRTLPEDQVFQVDRDKRTLWLNARHRRHLGGVPGGRIDDAPVVKAFAFLLLSGHADGSYAGAREKRLEVAWNAVLAAAVRESADRESQAARTEAQQGGKP